MKYMIIKKSEYEKLKKNSTQTIDNYTYLLTNTDNKIKNITDAVHDLGENIKITLEKLCLVETARRKNAGKVGALTTNYSKEKRKTKELLNAFDNQKEEYENKITELEDIIALQGLELEKKDTEIKIQKNNGKKKQMDDYKKLEELTKDIEKHKRK